MQSLVSRGYVRETFNWQWYYYYLTDDGVNYLRTYLHLPAEIVPLTFKKSATSRPRTTGGDRPERAERGDRPRFGGDRPRRAYGDNKGKDVGPGEGFRPSFRREGGGFSGRNDA